MLKIKFAGFWVLLFALASFSYARGYETVSEKVKLESTDKYLEVQIELGMAEFYLKAADKGNLVTFDGEYDSRHLEPEFDYDRSGDNVSVFIGVDTKRHFKGDKDHFDNNFEVTLSEAVEIELDCELGLGENTMDLTGLKISRLIVESGLSSTDIVVEEENTVSCKVVDIECGLGELSTDYLGNLRFKELVVEGGLGDVGLDLRGFKGNGVVDVSVGMGSCTIILPKDVGVKLRYDKGLFSSVDAPGFDKVRRNLYESEGYDDMENFLDIDVSVGMGSIDIRWR